MDSIQRADLRRSLSVSGFRRADFTEDTTGTGVYSETWTHDDGSAVTVNWAPRTASTGDSRWNDALRFVLDDNVVDVARAEDYSGSMTPEILSRVATEVTTLADGVTMIAVQDAPGLYDEPDEGLSFPLPESDDSHLWPDDGGQ